MVGGCCGTGMDRMKMDVGDCRHHICDTRVCAVLVSKSRALGHKDFISQIQHQDNSLCEVYS